MMLSMGLRMGLRWSTGRGSVRLQMADDAELT